MSTEPRLTERSVTLAEADVFSDTLKRLEARIASHHKQFWPAHLPIGYSVRQLVDDMGRVKITVKVEPPPGEHKR